MYRTDVLNHQHPHRTRGAGLIHAAQFKSVGRDDRAIDVEYRVGDIEIGILTVDLTAPALAGLDSLVTVVRDAGVARHA